MIKRMEPNKIIDRKTAKALDLKRYFTGKQCKNKHIAERIVANGGCILCHREIALLYGKRYPERVKKMRSNTHAKNRKFNNERSKIYYSNNKERLKSKKKEYNKSRKDYWNALARERRIHDINFRLVKAIRSRQNRAIRRNQFGGSAIRDLGCSIEFLKTYLETMFIENMDWNNWTKLWEIDHIIPLATFDLREPFQFLKAFHYSNLQPLLKTIHSKKTQIDVQKIRLLKTKHAPPE